MRIILQQKVANLGNVGDLVTVKPGFCRNYLIPGGKAVFATPENIKEFEARRSDLVKKEAERTEQSTQKAEQLAQLIVKMSAKASEEGKLFGSISPREIADSTTVLGVEIHKSEVHLPEGPIRMVGEYEVDICLHGEVTAKLKVVVEAEK